MQQAFPKTSKYSNLVFYAQSTSMVVPTWCFMPSQPVWLYQLGVLCPVNQYGYTNLVFYAQSTSMVIPTWCFMPSQPVWLYQLGVLCPVNQYGYTNLVFYAQSTSMVIPTWCFMPSQPVWLYQLGVLCPVNQYGYTNFFLCPVNQYGYTNLVFYAQSTSIVIPTWCFMHSEPVRLYHDGFPRQSTSTWQMQITTERTMPPSLLITHSLPFNVLLLLLHPECLNSRKWNKSWNEDVSQSDTHSCLCLNTIHQGA